MLAPRAELLHRGDGRIGDSGERAAPAGMGGADHPGLVIGEQDRRAIGGQDSEQQVRAVGDHRVGVRPLVLRPGLLDRRRTSAEWT